MGAKSSGVVTWLPYSYFEKLDWEGPWDGIRDLKKGSTLLLFFIGNW